VTTIGSTRTEGDAHSALFELAGVDLSACLAGKAEIARVNPHRHEFALLDEVIWIEADKSCALGRHRVGHDAFWVRGHFPGKPLMPGVLQIEAGAQLACYLWNVQQPEPRVAAFLRIEDAAFRRSVVPGDDLLLLCKSVKLSRRRFVSDIQGIVAGQVAFGARISGMALDPSQAE